MKKIAYVNPMSENSPEIYDRNLLKNMKNMSIFYFCSKYIQNDSLENVNYKKIYNYKNKSLFLKGISYIISQVKLLFSLRNDIQVVHFQWFRLYWIDYFVILILKLQNKKVILTAHNLLPHDTGMKYFNIHKKIYKKVDGIIVHESKIKKEINKIFKINEDKIKIIPHGLSDGIETVDIKETNNIELKKITFGLFGILKEYKGVDILLSSWDKDLQDNKDIQLIIAGKKEMNFCYEKNSNIKIIDKFLSEAEIKELLKKIDIFVLPYRKISQSGVLLSVLKYHKPVIVSNVGGLTEPFKIGNIGWILKDNNSESLKKVIKMVVKNKESIDNIKNNEELWEKIEKFYSWEEIGEKTMAFYKEIINDII